MLIPLLLHPKHSLPYVTPDVTIGQALDILEDFDIRCLPILDHTGTLYRGNIYKYHIYRHLAKGGSSKENVLTLLKNATKFVYDTDDFFTLFFKLSDLPHIAVLNDKHQFLGIVRHNDVMTMLSQSWCMEKIGFALTIELSESQTDLQQVIKIIKKCTTITGLLTFDKDNYLLKKRLVVTLPHTFTKDELTVLITKLEKKDFHVIEVENLLRGV